MALPDGQAERRRSHRFALHLPATLRERERAGISVRVIDISVHGCRIELSSGLAVGSWAWLGLGHIRAQYAHVVWCQGDFAGLEFAEPLHETVLADLLGRSRAPSRQDTDELRAIARRACELARLKAEPGESEPLLSLSRDCAVGAIVEALDAWHPDGPPPNIQKEPPLAGLIRRNRT